MNLLLRRLGPLLEPESPAITYLGLTLIAAGFALIGIGWFQVSGLTDVSLQMPYVVSAAMTGLGLIVVGAALVMAAARRQDADARIRKLESLEAVLARLAPDTPPATGASPASQGGETK